MVCGIDVKPEKIDFCDICVEGKHCRDPFNKSREKSNRPLERIHSDVCGPIDPVAWDGSRYFVSFIDDFTHFSMIYTIKKKSDVFNCLMEYEALVNAKMGTSISKLTIDQGREYGSKEQKNWYKVKGIQVEETIAYSPQQNGVAERFNRTLVEKVRTMLLESSMPKYMWNEAALTGVYLINRSPTKALTQNVTPAEMWNGHKPNISAFKIFGCKALAWLPKQKRKKLDSKSQKLVMIGYVPNGYKLWDMNAKKIITSRDVKFDETNFPYAMKAEEHREIVIRSNMQEGDGVVDMPVTDDDDVFDLPSGSGTHGTHEILTSDEDDNTDVNEISAVTENDDGDAEETVGIEMQTPRRSQRLRKPPSKYFGFHFGYSIYTDDHNFMDVPDQYSDISGRHDSNRWYEAVNEEL